MIDLDRVPADVRAEFEAVTSAHRCCRSPELSARSIPELDTGYAAAVDDGWTAQVLQR